jgi:hypothetical protein
MKRAAEVSNPGGSDAQQAWDKGGGGGEMAGAAGTLATTAVFDHGILSARANQSAVIFPVASAIGFE